VKQFRKLFAVAVSLAFATAANADWHSGKVTQLGISYDGSTVSFIVAGWTRNNCTCNTAWPNNMCLNRSRTSFKEEVAMLYSARARGTALAAHIDETTCSVVALYEID
jgi:hypothetical protein